MCAPAPFRTGGAFSSCRSGEYGMCGIGSGHRGAEPVADQQPNLLVQPAQQRFNVVIGLALRQDLVPVVAELCPCMSDRD